MQEMTPGQFDLIALLLRSQGATRSAARRVLIDGIKPSEAARELSITPQSASNTLKRFRDTHAQITAQYSQ